MTTVNLPLHLPRKLQGCYCRRRTMTGLLEPTFPCCSRTITIILLIKGTADITNIKLVMFLIDILTHQNTTDLTLFLYLQLHLLVTTIDVQITFVNGAQEIIATTLHIIKENILVVVLGHPRRQLTDSSAHQSLHGEEAPRLP
jgi:hypothetical protein